jgi:hypothetical protein
VRVEDDDEDLAVAQDAELVSLLHQPELTLGERHLKNYMRKNCVRLSYLRVTYLGDTYLESNGAKSFIKHV